MTMIRRCGFASSCSLALMLLSLPSKGQQPIYQSREYSVWPDRVDSGVYSARVVSAAEIDTTSTSAAKGAVASRWVLQDDISDYPQMSSSIPLADALYNLSLSELKRNTRADGAFNAGANWDGVWTRDVSYSILLSLAAIQPEGSKASLLRKVSNNRIIQDTGTGGSWPVSSDRVTWTLGAWEVYLATGDKAWLEKSYQIACNTIKDDELVVMDPVTGLAHGETTFLDWREQTYPRWMEPADIYTSEALGTNAVYFRTYQILAEMAKELHQPAKEWTDKANHIRTAINQLLWMKDRGNYGQYLYGRFWQTLSPRSDSLAEALTILFDIADPAQQDQILSNQAMLPYGVPTVFPETPNIPAYHNRTVWPFVQSFWNLAAAKRENNDALVYGLASIYRETAIFLTNKENFLSDAGTAEGTVLNSDRQLWSVAGNLAMTYRLFFGMTFAPDGLTLQPVVPQAFAGRRILRNFHYRKAVLTIEVRGFGDNVRAITVDGKRGSPFVSADLVGPHVIVIDLDDKPLRSSRLNLIKDTTAPDTPLPILEKKVMSWKPTRGALCYQVYRDGVPLKTVNDTSFMIPDSNDFSSYQVAAVSSSSVSSFLSSPLLVEDNVVVLPVSSQDGRVPYESLDESGSPVLNVLWNAPETGTYKMAFHYANGSGPINTDNKCAIRSLFVDGKEVGPIVLPQRGLNDWNNWGWSNDVTVHLGAGRHTVSLRFKPEDSNMNRVVNRARIDSVALRRMP
jgi:hypothetical protein